MQEGLDESSNPLRMDIRTEKLNMMSHLDQFGASDMNASPIYDNRGTKLRFMFTITDKEKALELYKSVSASKYFGNTDQVIKIFYLLPEPEFEKYADEEAEIFYKEEEEEKARKDAEFVKREAEKLERKNTGGSRKQGGRRGTERGDTKEMDNETVSRETGISFGGAKPVFTSNKPKTHAPLD